jgi:hypothetical protein
VILWNSWIFDFTFISGRVIITYQQGNIMNTTEYTTQVEEEKTQWFLNGVLQRADGPAVECADGTKMWYHGVEVTEQQLPVV